MDCFGYILKKEEIKTEDVENTENRIDLYREKEVKIKYDNDVKRKEVIDKKLELRIKVESTEQRIDKKPQDEADEYAIEKSTEECKEKASAKHREKDDGYTHKKIKQEIETCESYQNSCKKSGLTTRDDDSDFEVEEVRLKKKVKKCHSPSSTDDYCEKDVGNIKKEYDDCMHPAKNVKQEFSSMHQANYCDICNLTLNSHSCYQSHITGRKHKKKLEAKNVALVLAKSDINNEPTSKCLSFVDLFKSCSHPDPSKAGFYCSICNSHSNSSSMWEAHIIGKRHIANLHKAPGTAPSKIRNVPAPPGTVAKLYSLLKDVYEPVVGLDQIREVQRLDTDAVTYTCFLCGGSPVCEGEIVDHILLTKHREKYLEKISYPEFETVRNCQMSVRWSVIAELCKRVEAEKGSGKPEVYYAKN